MKWTKINLCTSAKHFTFLLREPWHSWNEFISLSSVLSFLSFSLPDGFCHKVKVFTYLIIGQPYELVCICVFSVCMTMLFVVWSIFEGSDDAKSTEVLLTLLSTHTLSPPLFLSQFVHLTSNKGHFLFTNLVACSVCGLRFCLRAWVFPCWVCTSMHLERVCERVNSEDVDLNIKRQADLHVKYTFSDYLCESTGLY